MKRFIVCFVLLISTVLSLCACAPTTIDEQGVEREVKYGTFVVIQKMDGDEFVYLAYHKLTNVVYCLQTGGYNGFCTPYFIYQDGALYGTIFQDGEIVPVPYAYAPLE
jgi:hypothetical protein